MTQIMAAGNSESPRRSIEDESLYEEAATGDEQAEHTSGNNAASVAALNRTLTKRPYQSKDANLATDTERNKKRHKASSLTDTIDDLPVEIHDCEGTHGVAEQWYDMSKMKGSRWLGVRARLEQEFGKRTNYNHLEVIQAIKAVRVELDEKTKSRNNTGAVIQHEPPISNDDRLLENTEARLTSADTPLADMEARQAVVKRIEDKWGMRPAEIIADSMRKWFRHRKNPLKWNTSALEGLCRIADECPDSVDFNTLRKILYEGYSRRMKSLEETELSDKDAEYVLDWIKGKQPQAAMQDNEAAVSGEEDRDVEHTAPPIGGIQPTPTLPANLPSAASSLRPNSVPTTSGQPIGSAPESPTPGVPVRDEAPTLLQSQQPPPTPSQLRPGVTSLVQADRKLAEAELNLSASLARRRELEADLTVARTQREIETLRLCGPTGEIEIMRAELAVSEANLRVQKARAELVELRKQIYK
jgi:hypothetical protein